MNNKYNSIGIDKKPSETKVVVAMSGRGCLQLMLVQVRKGL